MREEEVEIRTPDGVADGVVYRPENPRLNVIHLPDAGGVRPSHREKGRRLAEEGYTVAVVNFLYRSGKPPYFTPEQRADLEAMMKRVGELAAPLTPEAVARDASAYVDFFSDGKPVAVVGHCLSGQFALRIAAARPDRVAAAASFHGGWLVTDKPTSPHLELPKIRARLYLGHAQNDRSMPKEAIDTLERALKEWGGHYQNETYPALHGWTVADSPVHDAAEAERAFAKLKQLLASVAV